MHDNPTTRGFAVATPSEREISMSRAFDAPREMVFAAFTKPDLVRRWLLGPDGWSMPVCELDVRAGGTYRYVWRNDADRSEFGMRGTYREVRPPERIVHVESFDEPWYPGEAIVTTTFVEEAGSTTVTMRIVYGSREARDIALASGMSGGVAASYARLEGILGPAVR
jgi:uncharacterized protein YndB with AHSA1/START domain